MATELFINAAKLVHDQPVFSCHAIFERVGHGFSNAAWRYRLMFQHDVNTLREWYPPKYEPNVLWWNHTPFDQYREARIYALLLAHEMNLTGDL